MAQFHADIDYGQGGSTILTVEADNPLEGRALLTDALYAALDWTDEGNWPTRCMVHVRVWPVGQTPDEGLTQEWPVEPHVIAEVPRTGSDW